MAHFKECCGKLSEPNNKLHLRANRVATHTCASLLFTTERSFKKSHELPNWNADARQIMPHAAHDLKLQPRLGSLLCNLNLCLFFLHLCSTRSQKLYLAYIVSLQPFAVPKARHHFFSNSAALPWNYRAASSTRKTRPIETYCGSFWPVF